MVLDLGFFENFLDTNLKTSHMSALPQVYKTSPFIPITTKFDARYSFCEEDADLMASMGYNTIR